MLSKVRRRFRKTRRGLRRFSGVRQSCIALFALLSCSAAFAQESPYFITYDHHMEEPGNLEVATSGVTGVPRAGNSFIGNWTEFEYGVKGWWTTEFYLDGQSTRRESTVFTGFRWENRFRPLMGEHRINPVLYVEYENINGADKTFKEIVGFDSGLGNLEPNSETRSETKREIETKLILSSDVKGWNISENFIAEKNLTSNDSWEFGYAFGVSRPLAMAASPDACTFCRENFRAGVEVYGGLGDRRRFTLRDTSQYIAPVLSWELANGTTFRVSPTVGMTGNSHPFLVRFGVNYEIPRIGQTIRRWFR